MAHNFHDINGWLIVGIEGHSGFHIFPPAPMWFWKLTLLHPFTLGDRQHPTVLFNGVPSVTHQHEPMFLWPHLGIIPDPLDALTPLHILFGSHKCWLPRGAVEICGEKATCCVIGGPVSLNADCWEYGKWPTSLVLNPGTVQTTPTFSDFAQGALTLAIDLVLDLAFEVVARAGGALLAKFAGDLVRPLFRKGDDVVGDGLRAATKNADEAGQEAAEKGAKDLADQGASAPPRSKCTEAGHPVDVTSGRVVDARVDLSLPGAIELSWERHYSSARALERTSLGRGGWVHSFEQRVERGEHRITLRDQEGRDVYFRAVKPGERAFHRGDRLTLTALPDGAFAVYDHESRLTRRFAPAEPQGPALLRSIEDAYGNAIALEYSGARLRRVIDTAGREVRVKLTHGGRIARLEEWAGDSLEQWVDYGYTAMGELASATDALGYADRYAYDEDHRMVKTTLKNGVSFHYEYDPETGWCRRTWGDGGIHAVEIVPDLERRITRLSGNDEPRILHWNEDGLVVREETPDGILIRTCAYDADLYLLAEANGAGETIRYEYDARGNKIREIDRAGNVITWDHEDDLPVARVESEGRVVERYGYDERGRLREIVYPSGLRYVLTCDERGRVRAIHGEQGLLASFAFDARHNVVQQVDARGARTEYAYDAMGRPVARTDALGRRSSVEYDRLGRLLALRRPDGTVERWEYGPLERPIRSTDAMGYRHEMEYGGTGVLTKVTEPGGGTWSFAYTARERLRRVRNPRGESYEFTYDTAGRIATETSFDGRELAYAYSRAGRLARIDYPDSTFRAFSHDPLGNIVRDDSPDVTAVFHRDPKGRLLGAVSEQGGQRVVTVFERDALGRIIAETQGARRIRYGYNPRGRRTERIMPDGATTRYEYDAAYSLTGVQHDGYRLDIRLDRLGREVARHAPGQVTIQSERDALDRLIERTVSVGPPGGALSSVLAQRSWRYDENGVVERLDDRRWGATAFAHDAMGQLVAAQRGARREVFDYDVAGSLRRMLERFEPAPQTAPAEQEPWQIAPGNRLVHTERATYSHDRRGRRVLKRSARSGADGQPDDTTAYVWDCRDQLREVRLPSGARVAFTYDAFGRRIRKEVFDDGTGLREVVEFVWDGDMLAADIHGQRGTRTFVHAPGTFLPLLQAEQGEVFCYVTDHVGTPRELIDAAGRVAWSGAYSAWGELRETFVDGERAAQGRTVEPPFRLLGQYEDEESGLRYTRYRYFDPEVARWCSPDPLGIYGGNDLYGFGGAPTWSVDPFGLSHDIDVRITLADGTEIPEFRVGNVPGNRLLDSEVMLVQQLTGRTDLAGSTIRIFGEWHSCANCVNAMDNFRQLPENQGMAIQYTGLGAGRGGQGMPVTLYLGPDPVPPNMLGRDDYNAERDRRQRAARRRGGCG
ncbi:DUF6531 domain-containing protein [Sorangium sp. So ce394]|uniref:DUF6531 domain-containing protein n=1 Tax=Sorangium sp. So ce394 TaxID=3133310 RepID=UPI003F5C400F